MHRIPTKRYSQYRNRATIQILHILRPKTNAFAALIKNGDSAPPAPSEFIAFHNPGAKKPTPPIINALNKVVRYQILFAGVTPSGDPEIGSAIVLKIRLGMRFSFTQVLHESRCQNCHPAPTRDHRSFYTYALLPISANLFPWKMACLRR